MDILHLLHIQSRLVPEMVMKFNSRYEKGNYVQSVTSYLI